MVKRESMRCGAVLICRVATLTSSDSAIDFSSHPCRLCCRPYLLIQIADQSTQPTVQSRSRLRSITRLARPLPPPPLYVEADRVDGHRDSARHTAGGINKHTNTQHADH